MPSVKDGGQIDRVTKPTRAEPRPILNPNSNPLTLTYAMTLTFNPERARVMTRDPYTFKNSSFKGQSVQKREWTVNAVLLAVKVTQSVVSVRPSVRLFVYALLNKHFGPWRLGHFGPWSTVTPTLTVTQYLTYEPYHIIYYVSQQSEVTAGTEVSGGGGEVTQPDSADLDEMTSAGKKTLGCMSPSRARYNVLQPFKAPTQLSPPVTITINNAVQFKHVNPLMHKVAKMVTYNNEVRRHTGPPNHGFNFDVRRSGAQA